MKTLGVVLIYISCSFKDQRHVKPLFPLSSCPTLAQKRKLQKSHTSLKQWKLNYAIENQKLFGVQYLCKRNDTNCLLAPIYYARRHIVVINFFDWLTIFYCNAPYIADANHQYIYFWYAHKYTHALLWDFEFVRLNQKMWTIVPIFIWVII